VITIDVVQPDDRAAISDFVRFRRRVYRPAGVRVRDSVPETAAFFQHRSPFSDGREFHLLVARERKRVVARVVALLDSRYNRHWNERLGHLFMFEALAGARDAACAVIDTACDWLRARGAVAVRAGFGPFEPGFVVDDYDKYLVRMTRHTLPCYHGFLKDARFETEKGAGEYIITVSDEIVSRYRDFQEGVRKAGYEVVALSKIPPGQRASDFTRTWNESYASHWGLAPVGEQEFALMFDAPGENRLRDLSAIVYCGDRPVGVVLVRPERPSGFLRWVDRRAARELEHLSSFAVGVSPAARGRNLAVALGAHAYLQLVADGAKYLSYGLVVDDNWPSRRAAQKLGGYVCANYLTYRRSLTEARR
jgi:hypothetical protein